MKKFFSILICVLLCLISVNAYLISAEENFVNSELMNLAEEFSKRNFSSSEIKNIKVLYDFNDEEKFLFYDYGESGYIIIDILNKTISEAGFEKHKLLFDNNQKYYYNGPLSYYRKESTNFIDLHNNKSFSKDKVKIKKPKFNNEMVISESSASSRSDSSYTVRISGTLPNYSYNPEYHCGSCAAGMWLMYMDTYVNDNYVASSYETTSGVSLISSLFSYIEDIDAEDGSTPDELKIGLQNYINNRGISYTVNMRAWNATVFKNRIAANRPVIVDLDVHPTYDEHWVTAYGYYVEKSPNVKYIIVNDGWGSTNIYINPAYIGQIVY